MSYREAGDLEAAVTTGVQSLGLYHAAQMEQDEAMLACSLALTYMQVGNLSRAEELLTSAVATAERLRDTRLLPHVVESQAQVALARHDLEVADALVVRSLSLSDETGNYRAMASAHQTASRIALERGDMAAASDNLRTAVEILREHGPKARLPEVLGQLADLRRSMGDLAEATDLYAEALRIRR